MPTAAILSPVAKCQRLARRSFSTHADNKPTFDQNVSSVRLCAGRVNDVHVRKKYSRFLVSAENLVLGWLQIVGEFDGVNGVDVARSALVFGDSCISIRSPRHGGLFACRRHVDSFVCTKMYPVCVQQSRVDERSQPNGKKPLDIDGDANAIHLSASIILVNRMHLCDRPIVRRSYELIRLLISDSPASPIRETIVWGYLGAATPSAFSVFSAPPQRHHRATSH